MAKIQIKNSFITSSADITISSSMVKFSSGISAKNITGSFSGSIPALTSYYKQGGNSFGTTAILGTNDNQALTFETNNSEKVRIATDGNVGIGTSSPVTKLQVRDGAITVGTTTSTSGTTMLVGQYIDGNLTVLGTEYSSGGPMLGYGVTPSTTSAAAFLSSTGVNVYRSAYVQDGATHRWYTGGVQTVTFGGAVSVSERMRINIDGNLGIGTSSPAAKLQVYTTSSVSTTNYYGLSKYNASFTSNTTNGQTGVLFSALSNAGLPANASIHVVPVSDYRSGIVSTYSADAFGAGYFYINQFIPVSSATVTRFAIDNNGNVGIGTTSPSSAVSFNKVVEAYDATSLSYQVNSGGTYKAEFGISSASGWLGTSTAHDMRFASNGTERMRILSGGSIGVGTSSPATTLNVSGSTRISAGELQIEGNNAALRLYRTSGINYFDWASGQNLYLGTVTSVGGAGRTNKMVILNDGNVGIGTNAPTQRLDLSGSLRIRSSGTYSDPTDNAGFINYDSSGGIFTISARSNGGSTYMAFRTSNSGTGGERMRIINDGNIGIGTSSPSEILDVYRANTGGWNPRIVARDGTNAAFIGSYSGKPGVFAHNNALSAWADLYLNTVDATTLNSGKVFIGGNVGIGTTSPLARLHVSGSSTSLSAIFNGCIGIGTTSPVAKLSVYTTSPHGSPTGISVAAGAGGANLLARDSGNYHNWFPYTDGFNYYSADSHVFRSSNHLTNYVYINSNGNLGIGTTSPAGPLDVVGSSITAILRNTSATNYAGLRIYNDQNSGLRALEIDYAGSSYSGALITSGPTGESAAITTTGAYPLVFGTSNTARMTILSGGNVGIGTNSPSARFHVSGSSYFQGYTRVFVTQNNTIGTSGDAGNLQVNSINVHPNSTTETMYVRRFNSGIFQIQTVLASANAGELHLEPYGGNVGIGTTTVDAKLRVLGNVRATSFTGSFSGSAVGSNMFVQGGNSFGTTAILGTSDNQALILETNNTEKLRITTVGNVGIGTSTPTAKLQIGTQTYSTAPDANYFVVGNDNFSGTGPVGAISGYPATANRNQVTASLFDVVGGWEAGNGIHALLRASAYDKITTTPALVVLNNGNVGIGTSTPNALGGLHVYRANSGGLGGYAILDNNGLALANETALMFGDGGASSIRAAISSTTEDSPYYGDIKFKTGQSVYSSLNTRMIIKGNGNVGIGTTTTFAKLVVSNGSGENIEFTPGNATVNGGLIENINRSSGTTRPDLNLFTSNGSNGSIKFYTNGVNERMRVNYDGNVGIGTSSPTTRLHVYGSGGGFEFGVGSPNCYIETIDRASVGKDLNTGYYTRGSGSFTWNNGSYTERMRINGNGNLGIGSSSPAAKLDIVGTNSTIALSFGTTVPNNPLFINTYGGAQGIGMDSADAGIRLAGDYAGGGNRLVDIGYYSSGTIAHANWVSRLRVLNNGNVGIGTTSPICKLNVTSSASTLAASFQGNVGVGNTAGYYYGLCSLVKPTSGLNLNIMYASLSSGYGEILMSNYNDNTGASGWASYIRSYSNPGSDYSSILTFGTSPASLGGPSERMRITAAGYVGIGTSNTTPYSSLFPGQLVIDSGTSNVDGIFVSTNNSNAAELVLTKKNTTNSFGSLLIQHAGTSGDAIVVNYSVNTTTGVSGTNSFKVTTGGDGYFKGNVGIGTTSFVYAAANRGLLEIYGSTDSLISLRNSNNPFYIQKYSTDVYINNTDNGALILNTNNTERARITSVGNVGIGTNNPGYKLDVSGSVFISGVGSKFSGPGSEAGYRLKFYDNGGINNDPGIGLDGAGGGSESMWFNTLNGFYWNMGTNGVKMLLNSSGNLGIGTSTPTSKLHVIETTATGSRIQLGTSSANSLMSSTGVNDFIILTAPFGPTPASTNNNGAKWGIKLNGSIDSPNTKGKAACIYAVSEEPGAGYNRRVGLALHTSPFDLDSVERLRISNDGNVGIGTTGPLTKLHVAGTTGLYQSANSTYLYYDHTGVNTWRTGIFTDNTSTYIIGHDTGGTFATKILAITMGGSVGIGTTSPTTKLAVSDGTTIAQVNPSSNVAYFGTVNNYPMALSVNSSEKVRVDTNGNVGIGTSSPVFKLDVNGTSGFRDTMAFGPSIGLISWGSMGGGTGFGIRGESGRALSLGSNGSWDYLVINTSGNVGIGTTSPISKLNTYASGSNLSVFKVDGGNGTLFEVTDQLSGSLFSVNDVSGLPLLEVFSNNRIVAGKYGSNALVISGSSVGIGTTTPAYKLQVNGSFGATTKSFVIDHPTKEGKKLVYGSLESPYHGIRLTGRNVLIDGECKVQLPDYIYKLARPESVNIQITPIKCGKVIYVDEISVENNYFVVKYDKSLLESYKNYEFFWDFTATRSDVEQLVVEQ